ncbi:hypothetical protein EW146_g932 [Bondarzewia mesenterica]|uniref:Tyrosine--tRNA ligase n=1 Tax=Bondarzewia mesenterica TaxID=1095465 RepID=A0A4S4M6T8_9AGAM|nr:hypothetical protein EW146_g932 [Bondarzewia mesenterica]
MLQISHHIKRKTCRLQQLSIRLHRHFRNDAGLTEELENRGLISQITRRRELDDALCHGRQTVYSGIDPTARSLHIGHIVPMMCLIGGATALIGDPSGRSAERPHLERAKVEDNVRQLSNNVQTFFNRALSYAEQKLPHSAIQHVPVRVMNNIEWFDDLGLLEFLRTAGIHARVNSMITRESVQSRLNSQQGISFSEFSYQLLQAYDFLSLNKLLGCTIQVGGSDQWGNIVAGIELINRTTNTAPDADGSPSVKDKGYGITTPLLTTSTGEKFGKSAGNAVWLDNTLTSVFDFYQAMQYFLRTTDEDVGRYLRLFTLIPLSKIEEIVWEHHVRMTTFYHRSIRHSLVWHKAQGVKHAQAATKVLFGTDLSDILADDVIGALTGDRRLQKVDDIELFDIPVTKLAVQYKLASSNSAARTLVSSGGLYVNGKPAVHGQVLGRQDLIDGRLIILRAGKSSHTVLSLK